MTMLTKIFDMSYEVDGDQITIEQDAGCGEVSSVSLHSIHLRLICGELGLFKGDADAWREVEKLSRRIRLLQGRAEHMTEYLHEVSDSDHADLTYERTFAQATADLASEFVLDLPQLVRTDGGQDADLGNGAVTPASLPGKSQVTPRNAEQRALALGGEQ
jgi:hypothetical protein